MVFVWLLGFTSEVSVPHRRCPNRRPHAEKGALEGRILQTLEPHFNLHQSKLRPLRYCERLMFCFCDSVTLRYIIYLLSFPYTWHMSPWDCSELDVQYCLFCVTLWFLLPVFIRTVKKTLCPLLSSSTDIISRLWHPLFTQQFADIAGTKPCDF